MKNILLSLLLVLLVSACSSGSTVADTPFNITGLFSGTYESNSSPTINDVRTSGRFTLNIVESDSGVISGNILFENDLNVINNGCVFNALVNGFTSGFSVALTAEVPEGETFEGEAVVGQVDYQLTQSNSGNTLTGTYIATNLQNCSNFSGAGTVTINRI